MSPGGRPGLSVARYLRAEEQVVPFRVCPELDELLAWCVSGGRLRVRLLTGDGGAGKTRLALRLCTELSASGWRPLWVHPGTEGKAAEAVRRLGPCVLVVDYAETRDVLRAMLSEVVADTSAPEARVLLLARGPGEWWQRLISSSEERVARLLAEPPVLLGPLQVEGGPSVLFDQALTAFADKLQVARPDVGFMLADPEPVVLEVHAAALLAVLDHAQGGETSLARSATEALDGLLAHESRYWAQSAAARGLDLDVAVQRLVVAVGCLIGADSETAAAALMACIPDLADSAERRGKVARWLHDLYPEGRPDEAQVREWIGPLRPDPVAEHLVVGELSGRPELVPRLFADLGENRAARALTVLARAAQPRVLDFARAWTQQEDAQRLIAHALNADLAHLAVPAAQVALETRNDLGTLLAAALQDAPISQGALIRVVEALPYPSVALAPAHLAAALRVRTSLARDAEPAVVAEWSDKVGVLLIQLGRFPEAVRSEQEAIAIYRELAQVNPERYRANLAQSLMNLGAGLSQMGRPDGLPAEEEALDIWRELAQANPGRFRPNLAAALSNLGVSLSELGRHADALPIGEQALAIRRELAQANLDRYRPDLAQSLTNAGWSLSGLGRHADALDVEQKAVDLYQELTRINPDRYRPELAQSLANLGVSLSELGRHTEAQLATEEAAAIRRELAQSNPGRYHANLAQSLTSLTNRLTQLGRHAEALPVTEEAVAIYRELAQSNPDRYRFKLAASLISFGNSLAQVGRHAEARPVTEEAVAIRRELAEADPGRYRLNLATSLAVLGARFVEVGRLGDALQVTEEAVAIYRELIQTDPGRYRPNLATTLTFVGVSLFETGRHADAVKAEQEAVALYEELIQTDPGRYRPDLAALLTILGMSLSEMGRHTDALEAEQEAVAIRRELAHADPSRYALDLAQALTILAETLSEIDRHSDAEQARAEASKWRNRNTSRGVPGARSSGAS